MQRYEIRLVAVCESCRVRKPLTMVVVGNEAFFICDDCDNKENN